MKSALYTLTIALLLVLAVCTVSTLLIWAVPGLRAEWKMLTR